LAAADDDVKHPAHLPSTSYYSVEVRNLLYAIRIPNVGVDREAFVGRHGGNQQYLIRKHINCTCYIFQDSAFKGLISHKNPRMRAIFHHTAQDLCSQAALERRDYKKVSRLILGSGRAPRTSVVTARRYAEDCGY
jgi:hypothetical protein